MGENASARRSTDGVVEDDVEGLCVGSAVEGRTEQHLLGGG